MYHLTDYLANNLLKTYPQSTLAAFKDAHRDGSLEALTLEENIKAYRDSMAKFIMLEAAAVAIGVGINLNHITALNFLNIPPKLLWPVSWYTLGAVKISSLVICKMLGSNSR